MHRHALLNQHILPVFIGNVRVSDLQQVVEGGKPVVRHMSVSFACANIDLYTCI